MTVEWTKDDEGGRLHPSYRITDGNGLLVATGILPEHAERIVRACNCHDDLVAALKALLSDNLGPQIDDGANWDACCDMAKAALAKAGEK